MPESARDVLARRLSVMYADGTEDQQEHYATDASELLAALDAHGFAVVPVEATAAMIEAAGVVQRRWAAMLAAAPKP